MIKKISLIVILVQIIILLFTIENKLDLSGKFEINKSNNKINSEKLFLNHRLDELNNKLGENIENQESLYDLYKDISLLQSTLSDYQVKTKFELYFVVSSYWKDILIIDGYNIYN